MSLASTFGPGPATPAVKLLLIANVAVYALQLVLALATGGGLDATGFFPLIDWFGLTPREVLEGLRVWQPFTYLFLHAHVMHAARHWRLLTLGFARPFAQGGGLIAYGQSTEATYRRAGYYVDRILKGTRPADLPIEQPTVIELVINRATAADLGLTMPDEVLLQATELVG